MLFTVVKERQLFPPLTGWISVNLILTIRLCFFFNKFTYITVNSVVNNTGIYSLDAISSAHVFHTLFKICVESNTLFEVKEIFAREQVAEGGNYNEGFKERLCKTLYFSLHLQFHKNLITIHYKPSQVWISKGFRQILVFNQNAHCYHASSLFKTAKLLSLAPDIVGSN